MRPGIRTTTAQELEERGASARRSRRRAVLLGVVTTLALITSALGIHVSTTTVLRVGNVHPIETGLALEVYPRLDGSDLVFIGGANATRPAGNVFAANLDRGTLTQITFAGDISWSPDVSEGRVVWTTHEGNRSRVFVSPVATASPQEIPTPVAGVREVRTDGDRLFWIVSRSAWPNYSFDDETDMYNLTSGAESIVSAGGLSRQQLAVKGDRVLWEVRSDDYAPRVDVVAFDLAAGGSTRLTTDGLSFDPEVDGDLAVYSKWDNPSGNWEVYLYDLFNGQTTRVTANGYADSSAVISGSRIAWVADPKGPSQVFLMDLTFGLTIPVTDVSTTSGNVAISDRYLVWEDYGPHGLSGVRLLVGEIIVEHYPFWYASLGLGLGAVAMSALTLRGLKREVGRAKEPRGP